MLYLCTVKCKNDAIMETRVLTVEANKRRIARRKEWLRTHKGMIYEVTDPELRSQLCYYRKREKKEA